jgi:hypothetical protein
MLVPPGEIDAFHTPRAIADHVTRFALAAVGVGPPVAGAGSVSPSQDVVA